MFISILLKLAGFAGLDLNILELFSCQSLRTQDAYGKHAHYQTDFARQNPWKIYLNELENSNQNKEQFGTTNNAVTVL